MLKLLSILFVSILGTATASATTIPSTNIQTEETPLEEFSIKDNQDAILQDAILQDAILQEDIQKKIIEKRLICKGCNDNENTTLAFLQDNGITYKHAIATIMGNIRQESSFFPNICEGGARVSYHNCKRGGYGAIQWTDNKRYYGLGSFATKTNGNPSSLETQLQYLLYEDDWKMIEPYMKRPGGSIDDYMRLARKWIRWGHHGARTHYSYDYLQRLILVDHVLVEYEL